MRRFSGVGLVLLGFVLLVVGVQSTGQGSVAGGPLIWVLFFGGAGGLLVSGLVLLFREDRRG